MSTPESEPTNPLSEERHQSDIIQFALAAREVTLFVDQPDEENVASLKNRRAFFGRNTKLLLQIRDTDIILECDLSQSSFTVGRTVTGAKEPHIDLSDYDAKSLGVSRQHARFMRVNALIMVKDMGALNGTYINGERLSPTKSYVICDSDEVQLANLIFKVIFEK